jgi:hypothetical protein
VHSRDAVVRQQITVALSQRIFYLVECDPTKLAERPELGTFNFQSGKDLFRRAVELGKDAQGLSLELLPPATREQLYEVLDGLVQSLKRIEFFTPPANSDATKQRDALLYDVEGQYEQAFNFLAPYLAYLQLKSAQVYENTRRSADLLQQSVRQVNGSLEELRTKLAELDRTLEARPNGETDRPRPSPGVYPEPVTHGHANDQITYSWLWFTVLATGVIAGLIWISVVFYHWQDYRH